MTLVDVPLVPPGRLAALLISRRRERGLGIVELAALSRGAFSPSYLDAVERGALQLDDESLRAIVSLYELGAGPIVPDRNGLVLDLKGGLVGVGDTSLALSSSTSSEVLERYVSLLYLLRGESPGKKLTLRDKDLQVLEQSLGRDQQELADQLFAIMGESATAQRTSLLSKRTVVLGAGLLVGVTTVGSLVIIGSGSSQDSLASASPTPTEIVSSQRSTGGATATFASFSAPADAPQVAASATSVRVVQGAQASSAELVVPSAVAAAEADTPADSDTTASATAAPGSETVISQAEPTPAPTASVEAEPTAEVAAPTAAPAASATAAPTAEAVAPTVEPTAAPTASATVAPTASVVAPTAVPPAAVAAQAPAAPSAAELGAAAEALVGYDFRAVLPGWLISYAGDSIQFHGLTNSQAKTIVVYVEPGDTPYSIAEVLMHEVGHAIDLEYLDDSTRRQWIELRNMPSVWWSGDGLSDFAVGAGDFAEAVAAVTTGSPSDSVYGGFTAEQLSFVRAQLP